MEKDYDRTKWNYPDKVFRDLDSNGEGYRLGIIAKVIWFTLMILFFIFVAIFLL